METEHTKIEHAVIDKHLWIELDTGEYISPVEYQSRLDETIQSVRWTEPDSFGMQYALIHEGVVQ